MPFIMPVALVTQIDRRGWPAMRQRDWNNCRKEAYRRTGLCWLNELLPRHFKPGAAGVYGYEHRTKAYNDRKMRLYHHTQPLIFSGEFKEVVTDPVFQRVIATNKGATVKLNHTGAHPIVHRVVHTDVTRVTVAERRELSRVHVEKVAALLNAYHGRETIKIAAD